MLEALWSSTLQDVVDRAAHEIKDSLNGVSLNLEVIRSRSHRPDVRAADLNAFAEAASSQIEMLTARTESLLFLTRPPRAGSGIADVALTLRHLATLLVPAARADGGDLTVEGWEFATPTSARAEAVRLALASGLLELVRGGKGGRCRLEPGSEPVVRFSHESAAPCSLAPAIANSLAEHKIKSERSGSDLLIVFPGP